MHTPGPWSVYGDADKVAAHGAKFPAIGTIGEYLTESITNDRGEFHNPDDALLCSYAPDLLKLLTEVVNNPEDSAYWFHRAKEVVAALSR